MQKTLKKYYIRTYGCQMNELDTDVMRGILERRGLAQTEVETEADLLIFNTCSIRDLAERKVMGKLGKLGSSPKMRERMIGVTGCMANAKKEKLFNKLPYVDFVLGTNNIHELDSVIDEVLSSKRQILRTDTKFSFELDYVNAKRQNDYKAFVSIIRGCDKFCTYCVVPYTRGPEVSRDPDSIIEECKQLAAQGVKEVTLLGQNVNSYGKDRPEWNTLFHDLLYRIDKETGISWVRFLTSHPVDITTELMHAIRDLPSACELVHFPVQSGSNRILKKMHRLYTIEEYLEKVELLKKIVPNVSLGTDIIVGFPTETEEEFMETYRILEQTRYHVGFIYSFSERQGTPAKRWKDDVPEDVKHDRQQRLMHLQESILQEQRHALIGETIDVLIDGVAKDGNLRAGTRDWKNVVIPGDASLIGTFQKVKVNGFSHHTLRAELLI